MHLIYWAYAAPARLAYKLNIYKSLKIVQDHSKLHMLVRRV